MQIFFSFLICVLATTAGGVSGMGGGVLIKPVMDAASGLPVATISFLSGCTVLAMSITSMVCGRGGAVKIEHRIGTPLAVGAAVGGVAGKALFELVRANGGDMVSAAQQVMMILLTVGVLLYTLNRSRITTHNVDNGAACVIIGLVLGMLSSFLGIGGGPINLAVLYYFFSMDTKTAALNSLYMIFFSQSTSFLNTIISGRVPEFSPIMLLAMVAGGILGGCLGRHVSGRLSARGVDRLFLGLIVVIVGISCYNLGNYFL